MGLIITPQDIVLLERAEHDRCRKIRCALDLQIRCWHERCVDFAPSEEGGILQAACSTCYNREEESRDASRL